MMRSKAKLNRSDVSCFSQFCGACHSTENMISCTLCYWGQLVGFCCLFFLLVHAQRQFLRCDPLFLGIKSKLISVSPFLFQEICALCFSDKLWNVSWPLEGCLWAFCTLSSLWVAEDGSCPGLVIATGSGRCRVGAVPTHPSRQGSESEPRTWWWYTAASPSAEVMGRGVWREGLDEYSSGTLSKETSSRPLECWVK